MIAREIERPRGEGNALTTAPMIREVESTDKAIAKVKRARDLRAIGARSCPW
jgi:hypothetical protein